MISYYSYAEKHIAFLLGDVSVDLERIQELFQDNEDKGFRKRFTQSFVELYKSLLISDILVQNIGDYISENITSSEFIDLTSRMLVRAEEDVHNLKIKHIIKGE